MGIMLRDVESDNFRAFSEFMILSGWGLRLAVERRSGTRNVLQKKNEL